MLKRLLSFIIGIACGIGFIVGIIVAITSPAHRIPAIIVAVVCLLASSSTAKANAKKNASKAKVCKKCGGSLRGAQYEYHDEIKVHKELGGKYVQINVYVTCPHCGKETITVETIYINDYTTTEEIKRELDTRLRNYYGS